MYVCLCKGITDKQIVQAVNNGTASVRELRQQFGLGDQCGKCTFMARGVINEAMQNSSARQNSSGKPEIFVPSNTPSVSSSYFTLPTN
ncbi:bacterioferritin-associated ferredoxin [Idiomarina sp. A28L]|uniref:bacterioferritin-associated ferredoxin n=1 Tax=Idiomarina sp. A28L TaxID=1036674 RepID=UPI0002138C9D|nr:bacterioferritin-associated ferredoxin [Idiomarina sp. A28L]EGN75440.1 bacterioferritin-associated ferredoxin [Idiomarina sp. A28L]